MHQRERTHAEKFFPLVSRNDLAGTIAKKKFKLSDDEIDYYAFSGSITNSAYSSDEKINILFKDGKMMDIADASDLPNISVMSTTVRKYFLCGVKDVMSEL